MYNALLFNIYSIQCIHNIRGVLVMSKRRILSVSLNEEEMKNFSELKEYIYKMYYEGSPIYKDLSEFTNSIFLKHLILHEFYCYKTQEDFRN